MNCLRFYEHEICRRPTDQREVIFRMTRILSLWLFSLSLIYIRSIRVRFNTSSLSFYEHEFFE